MWSWLGYMNPHRLTWGFAYNFPFAMVVGLTTLIALVFYKGEKTIPFIPLTVIWLAFILWMNLSTLTAIDPAMSSIEWDRSMKIQIFALLTVALIRNKLQINALVWVVAASLAFFGLKGGIFSILSGGNYLVWGPKGSFIEDNNALGMVLTMTIPLLVYIFQSTNDKRFKLALLGVIALTLLAILTSHSRGAFLAICAMGMVFWYYSSRKVIIGVVLVLAAIVAWNVMPESWHERMSSISDYQNDSSAMGRINAWWFAYNLALDHPFTGGGFGTFTQELFLRYAPNPTDFHDSHSIYFEVLAEQGFVGLALFLMLGAGALITSMRNIAMAKKREDLAWAVALSRMLIVSLVAYAVGGLFLGLAYFDLYYHLISMVVIVRMIINSPPETEDYSIISEQMKNLRIKQSMRAANQSAAVSRNL